MPMMKNSAMYALIVVIEMCWTIVFFQPSFKLSQYQKWELWGLYLCVCKNESSDWSHVQYLHPLGCIRLHTYQCQLCSYCPPILLYILLDWQKKTVLDHFGSFWMVLFFKPGQLTTVAEALYTHHLYQFSMPFWYWLKYIWITLTIIYLYVESLFQILSFPIHSSTHT